ncbi:hypothetical protein CFC21_003174 [Triticum aestivum]|uniref:BURP domain-containing protein n=2 Tax=Triticum TaxID=4564 RepID=A0A9R0V1E4_TRITD|nr:BURP domain-containing protein 4-like [Triticum dicoccoides]XP_044339509.1 BURP domain-containing protein 4-like isoform X1 [Triticum aestivum]KAF6985289.1 hypothetical protein CFC21_003174 [Triticum aestivum]VAH08696.1 unnamed protein product [Triticum turgidum subsp. durum]
MMTILIVLFVLGFVAGAQQTDGNPHSAAYDVTWSPRGPSSTIPPLHPSDGVFPTQWCNPRPQHLKADKGILFLRRNLFDGAVLPAGTKLGHARRAGTASTVTGTNLAPPPFDYGSLRNILTYYNIAPGSEQARQVASTLRFCGRSEARGGDQPEKPHLCATTERAAMEFAAAALGAATAEPLRTVVHGREEPHRYVVAPGGVASIAGAVVPCHPLPYPADVLYCHRPSNVGAVRVELVGQDDPTLGATAIAVCHEDTSGWDAEYFATLNGSRGEPICHYMPEKYVVWVGGEIH